MSRRGLVLAGLIGLILTSESMGDAGASIIGAWHEQDLLGLEIQANVSPNKAPCVRAWFKTRDLIFTAGPGKGLIGSLSIINKAHPVGLASIDAGCPYVVPGSPTASLVFRSSMWSIYARETTDSHWVMTATPTTFEGGTSPANSPPNTLNAHLRPAAVGGELMVSRVETPNEEVPMAPVRTIAKSDDSRQRLLDSMVRRLTGADCAVATVELMGDVPTVQESCDLRRRAHEILGALVSVRITGVDEVDRMPLAYPMPGLDGPMEDGQGALVSFFADFSSNSTVPGDALFIKEGSTWKIKTLWF